MDCLRIVSPGLGASVQDPGRVGWKRLGVPPGGSMDSHASGWANRLVGNPEDAPLLELLLQGVEFEVLAPCRIAVTGADAGAEIPCWYSRDFAAGQRLRFPKNRAGLWTYVAVAGGFVADRLLGSASVYPRGGIGRTLAAGDVLACGAMADRIPQTAGAWAWWAERRNYLNPPLIRLWPGPQWEAFDERERQAFFQAEWEVSSRSDRVGYRLEGARLNPPEGAMISEPVLVGSIQVPPNGQPIVTMRDGPTVGGYPKVALVDEDSLPWLVQCRPGGRFQFVLVGDGDAAKVGIG